VTAQGGLGFVERFHEKQNVAHDGNYQHDRRHSLVVIAEIIRNSASERRWDIMVNSIGRMSGTHRTLKKQNHEPSEYSHGNPVIDAAHTFPIRFAVTRKYVAAESIGSVGSGFKTG
jgi:hypothetical protein